MAGIATRAVRSGDHYLVTGNKIFITNGVYGDLYFLAARTGPGRPERRHEGISMFLVERASPGLQVSRKLDKMGMWTPDRGALASRSSPGSASCCPSAARRGFQQLAVG